MYTHVSVLGRLVTNGAAALTIDGLQEQRETGLERMQIVQIGVRFFYSGVRTSSFSSSVSATMEPNQKHEMALFQLGAPDCLG